MKEKILKNWARFAALHPWWVIGGILLLSVISLFLIKNLDLNMRYSDLLPEHDKMAQEFDRIIKEYKSASNSIIVLQGTESEIKRFADTVVPKIRDIKTYVDRVDFKIDEKFIANHGFMLTRAEDLEKTVDMFKDLNLIPLLTHINDNFEAEYIGQEEALSTGEKEENAVRYLDGLAFWIQTLDRFVGNSEKANKALADTACSQLLYGDPYIISQDKHTLLILVKPTFNVMDVAKCIKSTDSLQTILNAANKDFPEVRAGLTGMVPMQRDENVYVMKDLKNTFIIALVLVMVLFMVSFRMWSAPLLAGFNLLLAVAITAGVISIYPGRLNPMTAMFAAILIGLGIDFSIHIISVYNERRAIDRDAVSAMEQTLLRSGSGIITGGVTTAAAFFTLVISVSRGIKEMGIILGIGIICAMLTTLAGLPALLIARERMALRITHRPFKPRNVEFTALGNLGKSIRHRPLAYILIGIVLTGLLFYQMLNVKFDPNMLNIEPRGIKSVALHDTLINAFSLSTDFAMVTTSSIEESYKIAEDTKEMPSVSLVENISDWCPPLEQQLKRRVYVQLIHNNIRANKKGLLLRERNVQAIIEQLKRLDMNIYELSQTAFMGGQDRVDKKCRSIIGDENGGKSGSNIIALADKIGKYRKSAVSGLNRFQDYYFSNLRSKLLSMSNANIIRLRELPEGIKGRFMNNKGDNFLVTIYAKGQVWNFQSLRSFTEQMASISPKITGTPLVMLRLIDYIGRDGLRATILTVVIVLLLLWLDFRSFRLALLGIIPLLAGAIWMVGLLRTFGLAFTVVNVMGIPMIVGIGIDDGVHLLHRYRVEGFNKTKKVLRSTGKAILLTSLTTMVGFGSLLIAKYRGFIGLGALLLLGVGACFITTVLFLPAIISLMQRRKGERQRRVNS